MSANNWANEANPPRQKYWTEEVDWWNLTDAEISRGLALMWRDASPEQRRDWEALAPQKPHLPNPSSATAFEPVVGPSDTEKMG